MPKKAVSEPERSRHAIRSPVFAAVGDVCTSSLFFTEIACERSESRSKMEQGSVVDQSRASSRQPLAIPLLLLDTGYFVFRVGAVADDCSDADNVVSADYKHLHCRLVPHYLILAQFFFGTITTGRKGAILATQADDKKMGAKCGFIR